MNLPGPGPGKKHESRPYPGPGPGSRSITGFTSCPAAPGGKKVAEFELYSTIITILKTRKKSCSFLIDKMRK